MKYRSSLILFVALALATPAYAQSQPSAADRTTARRLAIEGQIALKKGDYDTAADRFERANDLVPAPSILVRLAKARAGQGRLVEAYEIYREIIRDGVEPNQPEAFKRALVEAKQEVKLVEPRLAWVSINVVGASPERVEVTLNGSVIPSAALGAQRPVDPGTLHARAKAEGYRTAEAEVQLSEGQHLPAIELRMTELPKAPSAIVQVGPAEQPVMTSDGGEPGVLTQSTLGYVALGLGGVGLAIGTVTGIIALNRHSQISDIPCQQLDAQGKCHIPSDSAEAVELTNARADFDTFATAADVSFITGGVLAATGLILLFTAPDDTADSEEAMIRPFVGIGSVGAVGRF
jgi:pentatricopeptide repeat protein